MNNRHDIPPGILQNNPGCLKSGYGSDRRTQMHLGLAKFDTMEDGCHALARMTFDYYTVHGLRTLPQFIGRFANGCDHDHIAYIRHMAVLLHHNPMIVSQQNLDLHDAWKALTFMRAITIAENGHPLPSQTGNSEWIHPAVWVHAIQRTGHWPCRS